MNYWIITDTHFGHEETKVFAGRPDNYEQRILKNLKQVREEDILIHLGDVAFKEAGYWFTEMRKAVKGKIILVKGNHDKHSLTWMYDKGIDFIADSFKLKVYGKHILFSHKPMLGEFDYNIFGHFHNNPRERWEKELVEVMDERHKLMTLEHNYTAVSLKKLVENFN